MKTVLTIAGSDCSGGAGIQADIKTVMAHGLYATSVITALTAQNTLGVFGILDTPAAFVAQQLDCVLTDIPPDAIKIGMVSNASNIETIVHALQVYKASPIVIDPIMISTSGRALLQPDAVECLTNRLLPLATVITPNLPESEALCGFDIHDWTDMERAAHAISDRFGCAVLVKGGHLPNQPYDLLCENNALTWLRLERVDNPNSHGTGCTLSAAIACGLASDLSLADSVKNAKTYVWNALASGLNLGHGNGPLNHAF